ncbi:hypothetical protein DM860_017020 [Cuscuta australis]|uniref:Uncharacterized protein n=1 Tax=Cuscuta australis TaxID=267555 RepID=A0A328DRK1_9ASTE|nr:hypothetical protein DM860_017020 [Cuscuta australis]
MLVLVNPAPQQLTQQPRGSRLSLTRTYWKFGTYQDLSQLNIDVRHLKVSVDDAIASDSPGFHRTINPSIGKTVLIQDMQSKIDMFGVSLKVSHT